MTPLKILIIEDLSQIRDLFEIFLEKKGFVTLKAAGGEAGVEVAKRENPALILVDLRLPDIDGMEVLRRIREFDKKAKIFMLSGLVRDEEAKEAVSLGATGIIDKKEGIGAIAERVAQELT